MSKKASKIAISLPPDLLAEADRVSMQCGETRSEFIRRAMVALLKEEQQRREVRRYVQSYRDDPEAETELGSLGLQILARDAWE